jgi:hypothetical protein
MSCRDNRIAVFDVGARKFEQVCAAGRVLGVCVHRLTDAHTAHTHTYVQFLTGLHTGLINAMLAVVSGVSPAGLALMPRGTLGKRSVSVWTASSDKSLGTHVWMRVHACVRVPTTSAPHEHRTGCWPANSLVKKAMERAAAAADRPGVDGKLVRVLCASVCAHDVGLRVRVTGMLAAHADHGRICQTDSD